MDPVAAQAGKLFERAEGALDTSDIEHVHKMRVASRRLRAALEVYAPCFERKAHRRVLRDVKALTRALGARRDADVHLEQIAAIRAQAPAAERPGLDHLATLLRAEQEEGNRVLAQALQHARESGLRERLGALEAVPVEGLLEDVVAKRRRKVAKLAGRAMDPARAGELHRLRIAVKRLRYAIELAGGPVDDLKALQDALGEIHDCDVQLPRLRALELELAEREAAGIREHAVRLATRRAELFERTFTSLSHANAGGRVETAS